jgi:YidC/Oxa1 family membrane protein insertase
MEVGFDAIENTPSHQIPADAVWEQVGDKTDRTIVYRWTDGKDLEVTKSFELVPEAYVVKLSVTARKLSDVKVKQALRITTYQRQDPDTAKEGSLSQVSRIWRGACYRGGDPDTNSYDYLAKKGPRIYPGKLRWSGFTHSYFLSAVAVKDDGDEQSRCELAPVPDAPIGTMRADLVLGPPKALEAKDKIYQRTFAAYMGPKYLDHLEEIDSVVGFEADFEHSIDLGWFSFIARPLLWLLKLFHGWLGNWGLAIILLTFVVKAATLYWTHKSMKSMRAMTKLKPQMEEIQRKFKDDRSRQQQEIMAMYKANKVNPLSGCLPMLLQMPIWFALYKALNVAAELYQAPFIPGWIDDLTAPDRYYVLPVMLMVMMFVQARITPTSGDSAQQKMMQYGLPLVFGVFGFFFPAGLTVYIFTNTALSALHGLYIRKTDPLPVAKVVAGGGGGAAAADKPAPGDKPSPTDKPAAKSTSVAKNTGGKAQGGGGGGGKRKKDRRS